MITKTVTYENFNGETVKKDFHFHISKHEMAELQFREDGSKLDEVLVEITKDDTKIHDVLQLFKDILGAAVGVKSADGERFIKSDDARSALFDTDAYSELLFEMLDKPEFASTFIQGMLPRDLQREYKNVLGNDTSQLTREELLAKLEATRNRETGN